MNQMKRITIRVPSWVKDEMDRRSDINWSQKVREDLIKCLKKEDIPIELRRIIREYKDLKKWNVLKALFLYAIIYETTGQPLKTNLSVMFEDKAKNVETEMFELFEKIGIKNRYDKVFQDRNFCDILLATLFEEGIIDDLEEEVIRSFNNLKNKEQITKALWHLGLYLEKKNLERPYVCFEDREMEILFSNIFEKPEEIINELNKTGIIYYNYYNSIAYSHKSYNIPVYSYRLIRDIQENPYKYSLYDCNDFKRNIEKLLSDDGSREFLKRMKNYDKNFSDNDVLEVKKQFDSKYGKNAFDDTLNELVDKGILICWYWPHRRRAGKRSSQSARTYYKLSNLGKKYLSEIIFKKLVKSKENKGELVSLIEIYENRFRKYHLKE